jgi:tRNA pseudouridine32 synthase/23S rRNA pseudouridine746 synthase
MVCVIEGLPGQSGVPDEISMQIKIDTFVAPHCADEIEIVFQDEHFLLINKPSGLLSLSGKNPLNRDSVHYRLVQDYPTATLVHRLDFGTSGIIVVALNKQVNARIGNQFQAGTVAKTYTALLHGLVEKDSGIIDFPIAKDPPNFPLQKISVDALHRNRTRPCSNDDTRAIHTNLRPHAPITDSQPRTRPLHFRLRFIRHH